MQKKLSYYSMFWKNGPIVLKFLLKSSFFLMFAGSIRPSRGPHVWFDIEHNLSTLLAQINEWSWEQVYKNIESARVFAQVKAACMHIDDTEPRSLIGLKEVSYWAWCIIYHFTFFLYYLYWSTYTNFSQIWLASQTSGCQFHQHSKKQLLRQ